MSMNDKYTYNIDFVSLNIKFHRMKKGYTQEELAEMIGVSRNTIQFWESGKRLPSILNYFWICFYLDIPNFNLFAS